MSLTRAPRSGTMAVLRHQSQSGLTARISDGGTSASAGRFFRADPWRPPVCGGAMRGSFGTAGCSIRRSVSPCGLRLHVPDSAGGGLLSRSGWRRHVHTAVSFDWSQSPNNRRDYQPVAVGARTRPVGRRVEIGASAHPSRSSGHGSRSRWPSLVCAWHWRITPEQSWTRTAPCTSARSRHGSSWPGRARRGRAWHGWARHGTARRATAWPGRTGLGKARHGSSEENA